jgi:hypothetical protein
MCSCGRTGAAGERGGALEGAGERGGALEGAGERMQNVARSQAFKFYFLEINSTCSLLSPALQHGIVNCNKLNLEHSSFGFRLSVCSPFVNCGIKLSQLGQVQQEDQGQHQQRRRTGY